LLKSIPRVTKWLNDNFFIQFNRGNYEKVNARTGRTTPFKVSQGGKNLPKKFKITLFTQKSSDQKSCLFNNQGDIYYYSIKKDLFKRLTKTKSEEKNATFSPNGKLVAFTRNNDLYTIQIRSGKETRHTTDGSNIIFNGRAAWVYYEEIIGRRSQYKAFWWSPDSKKIVFLRFDETDVPKFTITSSKGIHGEVEVTPYPKPGDPNPKVRLGVLHLSPQRINWIKTEPNADHYIAWPFWTPDSKTLLFQLLNRGQDHLIIYSANLNTGDKTKVYEEKQDAWIDFFDDIYILKNNQGFILRSNKDGWAHLYHYSLKGKLINRITKGNFRVRNINKVDEKKGVVYFSGFKTESTNNHLFRIHLDGKYLKQLTKTPGSHRANISPNAKYFIDSFSSILSPRRLDLHKINGKLVRKHADSTTKFLKEYNLGKVELFRIPSTDGYMLPAIWTLPPNFDKNKKYPIIFSIYGGPDAGSVRNSFQRISNHYLASKGIITISVDHRASGHFGKKGVELMHRNLGKWETHDYCEAVKQLKQKSFIDPAKIGITGGSYGGYMTCMALTKGADYFTHGIAASSVTDWKLYDSIYTERFMDTPQQNPEGYKAGSVMTYAKRLKGILHILHGEMDDNVHLQNSIQLLSKLEDLNKDFTFMIYPGGRHGWGGAKRKHSTLQGLKFWFKHFLNRELDLDKD
jgi:dipeptidyl-peptidase-4